MAERDAASSMVLLRKRKARDIEAQRRSAETLGTRLVKVVVVDIPEDNKAKGQEQSSSVQIQTSAVTSVVCVVGESCSVVGVGSRMR